MTKHICTEPPNTIKTDNNSLWKGVNSNSKNTTHNGSMKGVKLVFLNIDRLYNRFDELRMFANEHAPHIICLNETKLSQDTQDELLASKTGIFAQRARVDQAVGLYYRKENLTF